MREHERQQHQPSVIQPDLYGHELRLLSVIPFDGQSLCVRCMFSSISTPNYKCSLPCASPHLRRMQMLCPCSPAMSGWQVIASDRYAALMSACDASSSTPRIS